MKKLLGVLVFTILLSTIIFAKKNKEATGEAIPPFLRGLPWKGKMMKHGLIKWSDKRPYTPLTNSEASKRGKTVYTAHCMECHGSEGLGDGVIAKKLGYKAANLKKSSRDFTNHFLAFQIEVGSKDMPAWADILREDEIWDLTHYLHELAKNK